MLVFFLILKIEVMEVSLAVTEDNPVSSRDQKSIYLIYYMHTYIHISYMHFIYKIYISTNKYL